MGHQKKKGAMLHVQHVQPLENRLRDTRTLAAYLSELSSSTFSMRTRIVSNFDWQACRLQSNFYSFSVCHTFRISWPPVTWYVLIGLETLLKGIKTFPRHIFFPSLILSSSYIFLSSKAAGFRLIDSPSATTSSKCDSPPCSLQPSPSLGLSSQLLSWRKL